MYTKLSKTIDLNHIIAQLKKTYKNKPKNVQVYLNLLNKCHKSKNKTTAKLHE